jgi:hypothetical protein
MLLCDGGAWRRQVVEEPLHLLERSVREGVVALSSEVGRLDEAGLSKESEVPADGWTRDGVVGGEVDDTRGA